MSPQAFDPLAGVDSGTLEEVRAYQRSRRRRALLIGLVVVLLAGVAAGGVALMLSLSGGPTAGVIEVTSMPAGASVTVNNERLAGTTPTAAHVGDVEQRHVIEVSLTGHETWSQKVRIPPGDTRLTVLAVLNPLHGKLEVRTLPTGAEVYLDGTLRGAAPLTLDSLPISDPVRLEVRKKGYKTVIQEFEWEGRTVRVLEIPLHKER